MPKKKEVETEEQRAERLIREAKEAEEAQKRQEEEGRLNLREKEMRERSYAKGNEAKIMTHWTKIMRQAKVEELRKEVEVLSQQHEREIDRKDALLQLLDRDLNDAEEQYLQAFRGHLDSVNSLLDLQYIRVRALIDAFMQEARAMEGEFQGERADITTAHGKHRKDLSDVLEAMQKEFLDAENEARQEFEGMREEIRNRASEEYNVLKISLESTIEELERHFEQAHQAYLASTEARTNAFRQLTKNDATSAKKIEKGMKKLQRLQEQLSHWRNKISANTREWEERNKALRHEKELMQRHYKSLKSQLDRFRAQQQEKLKQLAKNAGDCGTSVSEKIKVAERILKVSEMCRRLETEQEKVMPFYSSAAALAEEILRNENMEEAAQLLTLEGRLKQEGSTGGIGGAADGREMSNSSLRAEDGEEEGEGEEGAGGEGGDAFIQAQPENPADAPLHTQGLDTEGMTVEEWKYLDNFLRRYNKVLLERSALSNERARLEAENNELKNILKQYLDSLSITQDVVSDPSNPLLIVNGRLQKTLALRQQSSAHLAGPSSSQLQYVEVQGGGGRAQVRR